MVKVFIWKSIPAGLHTFKRLCRVGNGVRVEAKLTDCGTQLPPQLSCAGAVDEGGFTHSRVSQENHFEHSLRPRLRARFLQVGQERAVHHF